MSQTYTFQPAELYDQILLQLFRRHPNRKVEITFFDDENDSAKAYFEKHPDEMKRLLNAIENAQQGNVVEVDLSHYQ